MTMGGGLRITLRLAAFAALAAGLAGCVGGSEVQTQPSFYRSMASANAELDAAAAASMISGYRSNNGLGAVVLDDTLMKLAQEQSQAMARRNMFDHAAAGEFSKRLGRAGLDPGVAVENIGAGYHTLAEAFSGWRDSPPHRSNMLKREATRMGIAAVYAPDSKYKVFWTLIMAGPDEPKPARMPPARAHTTDLRTR
jgi:uncharacterized protein YkwD